jgi:asparagine synthase
MSGEEAVAVHPIVDTCLSLLGHEGGGVSLDSSGAAVLEDAMNRLEGVREIRDAATSLVELAYFFREVLRSPVLADSVLHVVGRALKARGLGAPASDARIARDRADAFRDFLDARRNLEGPASPPRVSGWRGPLARGAQLEKVEFEPVNLVTLARYGAFLPTEDRDWPPPPAGGSDLDEAIRDAVLTAIAEISDPCAIFIDEGSGSRMAPLDAAAVRLGVETGSGAELAAARARALEIGGRLTPIPPVRGGFAPSLLDAVVQSLGQPAQSMAPFSLLELYRELCSGGIASMISGDGADELFAGHDYYADPGSIWGPGRSVWSEYRAVRRLATDEDLESLFEPEYVDEYGRRQAWERSEYARAVQDRACEIADALQRLRFLDVALRMRSQCVDLQRRLTESAGLVYRAPLSDRAVVSAALGSPIAPRAKRALPSTASARAASSSPLSEEWRAALSPETARKHRIFRPERIEALIAELEPEQGFLPRALILAATTHRWLELLVRPNDGSAPSPIIRPGSR